MEAGTTAFVPDQAEDLRYLRNNRSYPRLDGYWGERTELVCDRSRGWRERRFEAADAVGFSADRGHMIRKMSDSLPAGGTIIEGGWDHEHCEICWATISPAGEPIGMFAEPDHWVCCNCYHRFIVPRSLDFIVDCHH